MIDLYYWPTPNGWKISIMLEECGLPYTVKPVNIGRGEQFSPAFLELSPNNRMPAIVDHEPAGGGDPLAIFESAAILQYLAEKTGRFMPRDIRGKYDVLQWVAWQVANLGPIAGQLNHFANYAAEKIPYAIDRFTSEMNRLLGVLERRLADRPYLPALRRSHVRHRHDRVGRCPAQDTGSSRPSDGPARRVAGAPASLAPRSFPRHPGLMGRLRSAPARVCLG